MTSLKNNQRKGGRVRRAVVAGAVALTLSAGGATAWALDRFVVQHVEISDVSAYQASQGGTTAASTPASSTGTDAASSTTTAATGTSYVSDTSNINISKVTTGSGDSTVTYYVADVVLADAAALQSAANNSFGENITETTPAIAEQLLADGVWNTPWSWAAEASPATSLPAAGSATAPPGCCSPWPRASAFPTRRPASVATRPACSRGCVPSAASATSTS
ncbi:hypothetical protein [Arthrobacter sp. ISL-72]|uniref:hypothetical protein n=1 Tax=Arthrobacter sp. ISL-72 TaxID=2819114 RepID=UPI002034F31A|nr:hypothetical protein [Arthrobacter sp. ISL-72]